MSSPNWFARRAEGAWTRREFARLASASFLGMSLPAALARAAEARSAAAKRVIVILEQGGLSHMDTWDPKPEAVAEHRSPFKPIRTSVPGIQFTDLLPETAKIAHKIAVVRSMHHDRGGADAHPNGTQYVLSGSHPAAGGLTMPDMGSVVSQVLGSRAKHLPPYVMVPGNHEQAGETRTGFLPASTRVLQNRRPRPVRPRLEARRPPPAVGVRRRPVTVAARPPRVAGVGGGRRARHEPVLRTRRSTCSRRRRWRKRST